MTIKEYFDSQRWTFAKTYAMFAPHEYIVRNKVADKEMFDRAFDYIEENGMRMFYYQHEKTYLFVGGWFYWAGRDSVDDPTAIINRCRPEDYDIVWMKRGTQAKRAEEKRKEQEEKLERKRKREEEKQIKYEQAELKFE